MFRINEYISLELRSGKTVVLLDNSEFLLCTGIFINVNIKSGRLEYDSVDEIIDDENMRTTVSVSP